MRSDKKGVLGEGVFMIYRLLAVAFIAFVILGVSAIYYAYYIDVRDAEARIMARDVVNCVSGSGVLDLDSLSEAEKINILSYCGFDEGEVERFFVRVFVNDSSGEIGVLQQGDSGALWVKELFEEFGKENLEGEEIIKYEPGYFRESYSSYVLFGGDKVEGKINVEVLVNNEF